MAASLVHTKGNRNPSLTDTIRVEGSPFDLTGSTVKLKMRADGSTVLKVDTAMTVVTPAAGTVRYDWAALDVDTGGEFWGWEEVTTSGKTQDTPEFFIAFLEHGEGSLYVGLHELKETLSLANENYADPDVYRALVAASRAIDEYCGRRFYPDADAAQVRYYTPSNAVGLWIDDLVTLTSLKTDESGDGVFENTWTLNTDFVLEPLNPSPPGAPWRKICVHPSGSYRLPTSYPRTVEITGKFGWTLAPAAVRESTGLLAHRLLKRKREAAFAVAGFGLDGTTIRVPSVDPDVKALLEPFRRDVLLA